ncbi:type II toxin-antitoxin system HipA family toxin [Streptomyces sp. NBC_01789]|uniref:type II toxin-antitoxin system HipA family toxin n=1 Tax=unclassified Streptomyces TaxID=2593676 RepID=UPI002251B559|nr:HipA domain-containing protein [Streptomyces sp. NBC_01789]MCX4449480.1 HipA domain-containing protein [Streptomyces sp. NBC_01789]
MSLPESAYGVWLHDRRVGTLHQRGDHTRFLLDEEYASDGNRPVLGLRFEQSLKGRYAAALRLPPWFSNLLPEGPLREWIAEDKGVSLDREMELLSRVGHDLPGAVEIIATENSGEYPKWAASGFSEEAPAGLVAEPSNHWRFSLAGIALKFSMLAKGDRLSLPAFGVGGDWIVKLPDSRHANVPHNEYTMMAFARELGMDVPDVRIMHRDELDDIPPNMWPNGEEWAYAVRRFDRDRSRRKIHIEDLAQVRDFYPEAKYQGNYETIASLLYRRRDLESLREFSRRLAFSVLVSNGDAHLKNWSLIYKNSKAPSLSPAYDLVATSPYRTHSDGPEDLGLKFFGSKRFEKVTLSTFQRLERRLGATGAYLPEAVSSVAERATLLWPQFEPLLSINPQLRAAIGESIKRNSATLLQRRRDF